MEPLFDHPIYEKILTLGSAGRQLGVFTQAARNRQTGELVTIKVKLRVVVSSAGAAFDGADGTLRSHLAPDVSCFIII